MVRDRGIKCDGGAGAGRAAGDSCKVMPSGVAAAGEEEAFLNPAVEEGFPVIIIIAVGAFLSSPSRSARALFRGAPYTTAVQFS